MRRRRQETEDEVAGVRRDWEETKRQMEEDVDTEIEKLKRTYVVDVVAWRDACCLCRVGGFLPAICQLDWFGVSTGLFRFAAVAKRTWQLCGKRR